MTTEQELRNEIKELKDKIKALETPTWYYEPGEDAPYDTIAEVFSDNNSICSDIIELVPCHDLPRIFAVMEGDSENYKIFNSQAAAEEYQAVL